MSSAAASGRRSRPTEDHRRAVAGPCERGSGTVLVLGLVAVVVLLGTVLAGLGQAQAARSGAQGAADLAAVAGADALRHGEDACAVARVVAARNGGTVDACADEGGGVLRVEVHRAAPGVARLVGSGARATAAARAGPASARGSRAAAS
ncbi:hypothetical protein KDY119_00507 [Luteimicrobium xylanilyticum]|uniref:Putative Flp pilus-assembly TadG-like N-terminal domain-containing protein n=1 Tax=Luteimicrobium xylanilyticum TaxID=1133546 RepID=A0A5P9Q6I5_9MICO|nr:Rv3654c family TadE-like protein [Luteimicrobium xylanilyticum]QFU97014.1 hypothetical protein KDY119_00507 [Luteimicrobium xylanilyticum]